MRAPRSSLGLGSLLVAVLVILALGVGTVYAAIPNGSGTYYACLTKSSGVVRLINYPKQKCATGERFIKWSQQGPVGPAGPKGDPGAKGDQGPKGDPGPADWNAIGNKPAGFADGVDNGDTTRSFIAKTTGVLTAPANTTLIIDYPIDLDVKVTPLPASDGGIFNTFTNPGYGEGSLPVRGRMYHYLYFKIYRRTVRAQSPRDGLERLLHRACGSQADGQCGFPQGTEAPQVAP